MNVLSHQSALACITCNRDLQRAIADSQFYPNLLTMLSAFIAIALLVSILAIISLSKHKPQTTMYPGETLPSVMPLTAASTILGIGLGGFIDGIVFHQILQWHSMLSARIAPTDIISKSVNMFWDGIFHAFTLLIVITGIILLWTLGRRSEINWSGRLLLGGNLLGWGLFNIVEGLINHHILNLHNVRDISEEPAIWNWGFLVFSLLLIAIGITFVKQTKRPGI